MYSSSICTILTYAVYYTVLSCTIKYVTFVTVSLKKIGNFIYKYDYIVAGFAMTIGPTDSTRLDNGRSNRLTNHLIIKSISNNDLLVSESLKQQNIRYEYSTVYDFTSIIIRLYRVIIWRGGGWTRKRSGSPHSNCFHCLPVCLRLIKSKYHQYIQLK